MQKGKNANCSGTDSAPLLPKVIVFDLDGTLWYPEMYMLWSGGGAPFQPHKTRKDALVDKSGRAVELLGNSYELLRSFAMDPIFTQGKVAFGVASTCDEPDWAAECMRKFQVTHGHHEGGARSMNDLFHFIEVYHASTKQDHFREIQRKATKHFGHEVAFQEMIFFDNQTNNTTAVSKLGVHCVYTPDGMTAELWERGLRDWQQKALGGGGKDGSRY
jgi:magnesium-dependent phosphatase 1